MVWYVVYLNDAKWCIYASVNYDIISPDNGMSPVQYQSIT